MLTTLSFGQTIDQSNVPDGQVEEGEYLDFDGVDDVVVCGTSLTSTLVGAKSISVEAFVKPSTNTGLGMILGNYDYPNVNSSLQFALRRDNNDYNFTVNDSNGDLKKVLAVNAVFLNEWQHIAGVWDGETIKVYVNGELKGSKSFILSEQGLFDVNNEFVIGWNANDEGFQGGIDEVRIWDYALTQGEIINRIPFELKGDETGLLSYYNFNNGFNSLETTLTDATSNTNHGQLMNFALEGEISNWMPGSPVEETAPTLVPATHLKFDGEDDIVNLGNSLSKSLEGKNVISVEAIIRPQNNKGIGIVLGNFNSDTLDEQFSFGYQVNAYIFRIGHADAFVVAENTLILEELQHVAGVCDGEYLRIYVDGELKAESEVEQFSGFPSILYDCIIGGESGLSDELFFEGEIDEVRVWDYALTETEIVARKDCELNGDEEGLLRYYNFNQGFGGLNNTNETSLTDVSANANHGTLSGFGLLGETSNWLSGSVITTGSICETLDTKNLVQQKTEIGVSLFPNPSSGIVNIQLNDNVATKLEVSDLTGKVVMHKSLQGSSRTINISDLASGVYLFKLQTAIGEVIKRVVKK